MAEPGSVSVDTAPRVSTSLGSAQTSPVGVVWCRQVDNEAESPGYTTIPEDFPGRAETLDTIRIVGNLTINIADTHDYWDPDPTQPLSYYPNIFLYPAFGGRYTCVGRMFLSTEDRPRLGMKTLVLDTAQLFATGELGATVLKWHASMGGPRTAGVHTAPDPDPRLYGLVGEGFLFHRGSTDPVLVIASDDWESTMQVILEMIRVLPASLIALGSILAFPYFLPQPKTNLHELTEQLPLALTLMRVPRREAVGERHAQRIAAWEKTSLTVRDITQDLTSTSGRGKENLPLVLQYVRDHTATKLGPIVQRVDLVETSRRAEQLFDPEHQGGRDRRKEMWRIGTAMESAGLLLQHARGRHVPVNVETAKRVQQYLQARLVTGDSAESDGQLLDALASSTSFRPSEPAGPGQVPPWLQRSSEIPPPGRSDRTEVVPVSISDDPSIWPRAPEPTDNGGPSATAPAVPGTLEGTTGSTPASPPLAAPPPVVVPVPLDRPEPALVPPAMPASDIAALRTDIERDVLRYIEQRFPPAPPQPSMEEAMRTLEQHLTEQLTRSVAEIEQAQTATGSMEAVDGLRATFEQRMSDLAEAQNGTMTSLATELSRRIEDLGNRQRVNTLQDVAAAETRVRDALSQIVATEVERLFTTVVGTRLLEIDTRLQEATRPPNPELDPRVREQIDLRLAPLQDRLLEMDEKLRIATNPPDPQLDPRVREEIEASVTPIHAHLLEVDERLRLATKPPDSELDPRIREEIERSISVVQGQLSELDGRLRIATRPPNPELDPRVRTEIEQTLRPIRNQLTDLDQRIRDATRPPGPELDPKVQVAIAASIAQIEVEITEREAQLRATWTAQLDQQASEQAQRDRAMRESVVGALPALVETRVKEQDFKIQKAVRDSEQRLLGILDGRARDAQEKVSQAVKDLQDRVSAVITTKLEAQEVKVSSMTEARVNEIQEAHRQSIADLQVRLESHFDDRIREADDLERSQYLDQLARFKAEVDQNLAMVFTTSEFDSAVRERLLQSFERFQTDSQRFLETRLGAAETRIRADQSDGTARLTEFEKALETRGQQVLGLEEKVEAELADLDRRVEVLNERLVPIVRKTWVRIGELEKVRFPVEDSEAKLDTLRREYARDIRKLQQEILERTADIRDRMEATIANQGKVWLAVIRQMSQTAVDTRTSLQGRASDDEFALESVHPGAPAPRPGEDIPNIFDPMDDAGEMPSRDAGRAPPHRRGRRSSAEANPP
jgi:hypothetical protein